MQNSIHFDELFWTKTKFLSLTINQIRHNNNTFLRCFVHDWCPKSDYQNHKATPFERSKRDMEDPNDDQKESKREVEAWPASTKPNWEEPEYLARIRVQFDASPQNSLVSHSRLRTWPMPVVQPHLRQSRRGLRGRGGRRGPALGRPRLHETFFGVWPLHFSKIRLLIFLPPIRSGAATSSCLSQQQQMIQTYQVCLIFACLAGRTWPKIVFKLSQKSTPKWKRKNFPEKNSSNRNLCCLF